MLRILFVLFISSSAKAQISTPFLHLSANTLETRFIVPDGYERSNPNDPFAVYLRDLKLQEHGAKVQYYNGNFKSSTGVYLAVLDQDIGHKNLHQCADAVIRQRAEFLFHHKAYHQIEFIFTNGFKAPYAKWLNGFRIQQKGNTVTWVKKTAIQAPSKQNLNAYLEQVYIYAGTLSLASELDLVDDQNLCSGDIFIKGGSPGHAILVIDVIRHKKTGKLKFLLAQSYMPAQQMQILINPKGDNNDPWFEWPDTGVLVTPEWSFRTKELMRFPSK